jgi:hypothetical protein
MRKERALDIAQVIQHLSNKLEALGSIPSTAKRKKKFKLKKKKKEKGEEKRVHFPQSNIYPF